MARGLQFDKPTMKSNITIKGHSVHKMLVAFPVGLLFTSIIFDVIHLITQNLTWATASLYMIGAGLVGGLIASPFGWADWWIIPKGTRAKTIGFFHGIGNIVMMVLFGASWMLRWATNSPVGNAFAIPLSVAGAALLVFTGFLAGELVDKMGISIHAGANPENSSIHLPSDEAEPHAA